MNCKIYITPRAKRSLKKLDRMVSIELLKKFRLVVCNDNWIKNANICKIVSTDFYRFKRGNYRIIFDSDNNIINVFDVKKRNENTYKFK